MTGGPRSGGQARGPPSIRRGCLGAVTSCGLVSPGDRPSTTARPAGPAGVVTDRKGAIDRPTAAASPAAAVRGAASRSDAGRSRYPGARHRDAGREAATRPDAVRLGGRRGDAGHGPGRCSGVARRGVVPGPRQPTPAPEHDAVRADADRSDDAQRPAAPAGDARSAVRVPAHHAGSARVGSSGRARSRG